VAEGDTLLPGLGNPEINTDTGKYEIPFFKDYGTNNTYNLD